MTMGKLEKSKSIIKEYYDGFDCGIFNSRSISGDPIIPIYQDGEITIYACPYYSYFEVFGLSKEEFAELEKYYESLGEE